MSDARLIRLHGDDNVLTAARALQAGDTIAIEGATVVLATVIPIGYKVAARDIARGEQIIKWGAPIGSATAPIARGESVHLHNMKSDYLPTYTNEAEGARYVDAHH